MGFHKRYISDNQIIEIYRSSGNQAVIDWYTKGVDALIISGDLANKVEELICSKPVIETEAWNEISELISDASIKKGFSTIEKNNSRLVE